MSQKQLVIIAIILAVIAIILPFVRQRGQPGGDPQLEQRVDLLEEWQQLVDPQIKNHGVDIIELQDSQKIDSMQIEQLNADVAYILEQLTLIRNKEIVLHIDTTWIRGDSVGIIGFKDSIFVRTKKQ